MESQAPSILFQQLLHNVSPVIMLLSTPLAEAACRKNNLRFLDLLRPFCILDRLNVPVRTASETSYRLQDFRLRLFYSSEIRPTPPEAAEEQLLELVSEASDEALNELQGDPQQLEVVKRMVQAETISSWFQRYSSLFTRTLAFSDHESFDHPVACLFVVSSLDVNPANAIAELSSSNNLPPLLNEGVMDPRILKHYVVLHDNQDDSPDRAEEALQDVCGAFEAGDCSLIRINSSAASSPPSVPDFWSAHLPSSKEHIEYGSCLQPGDVDEIQRFVINLCQKHVIPYMEQKVRVLNQQVAATRRGLKNQIKNLWWRKKDSELPETPSVYTYSSMESQIRILADYAFMLRDYELAVLNYRLLSSDYKADKSLKRYAGVMEMIGICLCLLDQSRKEADSSLEAAYISYQLCGNVHARYATRTAIWWAEVHKARSQFPEAAYVLFRAATEMDKEATLRAGVLLEQSAYCYLRCLPPMLRKYGFHLVLAGIRYSVTNQRKHAIRAYKSVISVYEGQSWNFINDHVNLYLGRISSNLGQLNDAVQHFMKLLSCSHQSATAQASFLKEFLGAAQSCNGTDEILGLSLPVVSSGNVHVRFEDQRTYAQQASNNIPEDVWSSLEEGLVPVTANTAPSNTWLDASKSGNTRKFQENNTSVAGEEVVVYFQVKNPLQIAIEVSSMELICDFQSSGSVDDAENRSEMNTSSLELSKETFTLRGGENVELALKVKPAEEGLLQVIGVRWILFKVVHGRYDFPTPEMKHSKFTKQVPAHKRLKFQVVGRMPKLEVSMHELPYRMNKGEIRRAVLEIHNPSKTSIKNLKLKTSHPGFLLVGQQGDLDLEFPKCLEDPKSESKYACDSVFCFPESVALEATSTILWPLWLHATSDGELTFKTVLCFQSSDPSSLKYRTVRMAHAVQVIPSLYISVQITPSPVSLERYLLRMDVTNVHSSESFWLRQASCVGSGWEFSPLQVSEQASDSGKAAFLSASVSPTQLLPAGQSSTYFFQLKRNAELHGGHISLGPPGSNEPLIDINSGPLSYFHHQQRILQQKASDEQVDVVLITSQYNESPDAGGRFLSHHICHSSVDGPRRQAIAWALEGPRCIGHDFEKEPLCDIPVHVALRNCSNVRARISVETGDGGGGGGGAAAEEEQPRGGWRSSSPPPSLENLTSSSPSPGSESSLMMPCGSYLWSASKSVTCVELEPGANTRVSLCLTVFGAGMFDLCDYKVRWRLEKSQAAGGAAASSSSSGKKSRYVAAPATRAGGGSSNKLVGDDDGGALEQREDDAEDDENVGAGHSFLLTVIQIS